MFFYYNRGISPRQQKTPKNQFFYKSLGKSFLLGFVFLQAGGFLGSFIYSIFAVVASFAGSSINLEDTVDIATAAIDQNALLIMTSIFSQIALILFCVLFAKVGKTKISSAFKISKTKAAAIAAAVPLTFITLYTFCFSAFAFDIALVSMGYNSTNSLSNISIETFPMFLAYTFALAVLPAIGEELLFRGVILQSLLNRFGELPAILLSAAAFMIMHSSPDQTVYQFFLGVILAYITIKSRSIIPAMVMHFTNNFYSILCDYLKISAFWAPDSIILVLALAVVGILLGLVINFLIIDATTNSMKDSPVLRFFQTKILNKSLPAQERKLLPLDPDYVPLLPPEPTGNSELDAEYNDNYQVYLKHNKMLFNKAYSTSTMLFWITFGICGAFWIFNFVSGFMAQMY